MAIVGQVRVKYDAKVLTEVTSTRPCPGKGTVKSPQTGQTLFFQDWSKGG